jgi:hypothetical protein
VPARTADLGPVQAVVIAYVGGSFDRRILDELRQLRDNDTARLVDLLFVARGAAGEVVELASADLSPEESAAFGAVIRELIGLGAGEEPTALGQGDEAVIDGRNGTLLAPEGVWFLADAIPAGASAAVALIEHRWAQPLREAVESAPGHDLVDRWIHGDDLRAIADDSG